MNAPLKPADRMEGTPPEPAAFHEFADLFPMLDGNAYREFVEDIREKGVQEPVVFLGGKILDGRNRYMAARECGIEYPRIEYRGSDPLGYVISQNLRRRHLDKSQRAMIANSIAKLPRGANQHTEISASSISQSEAAKVMKVSPDSVQFARKVEEQGAPGLGEAVMRGDLKVSAAADIAALPIEDQIAVIKSADPKAFAKVAKEARATKQDEKKARRETRERELGTKQRNLPKKKYGAIIEDPEWQYEVYSRETGMDRAPDNHYPTSKIEDIIARPVADIAADDSIYALWCPAPLLEQGMRVLKARGFEYITHLVWVKVRPGKGRGTGYWFTGEHELVLIGKRGNPPAPAPGSQFPSVFEAPLGRHSEKPVNVHEILESYFPSLPKIELNARQARDGWDVWGNEAPDQGEGA